MATMRLIAFITTLIIFVLPILCTFPRLLLAVQQSYPSTEHTMDCKNYYADNAGYLCEPATPSCETLAYFHVQEGHFSTLTTIATQLFNMTPSLIAEASGLSSSDANLSSDEGLYIPFTCSCNGNFTSHNVTYSITPGDTFVQIANVTYGGLTTCQAMQDANPNITVTNLHVGDRLVIPLRCACPSQEQKLRGIKLLVTYPVGHFRESISSVTTKFGITPQEFLAANNITNSSIKLFPAITVLLPFLEKPTRPPDASSTSISPPLASILPLALPLRRPKKAHLFMNIGIAGGLLFLTLIVIGVSCYARRAKPGRQPSRKNLLSSAELQSSSKSLNQFAFPMQNAKLGKDLSDGISDLAIHEKLASYSLEEIKQATQDFHPNKIVKGAVYRGTMKGCVVAVKGMTRDVSKELQILRKVNHANLVSLLGVCIASPEKTYLVYEFAENGSLHDWLHGHAFSTSSMGSAYTLPYRNRLQIALDVATAMEYIHDHTYPSFVHKDINSHNILLDSRMRGKIANFALAKPMEGMEPATRHIVGTQGYMSPEYVMHGMVSAKMDVYALGVVMLEMLSGEEAILRGGKGRMCLAGAIGPLLKGPNARERLREWIDPCVSDEFPLNCAYSLAMLARSCVAESPCARPHAREVAFTLSKLLQVFPQWEPSEENFTPNPSIEAR